MLGSPRKISKGCCGPGEHYPRDCCRTGAGMATKAGKVKRERMDKRMRESRLSVSLMLNWLWCRDPSKPPPTEARFNRHIGTCLLMNVQCASSLCFVSPHGYPEQGLTAAQASLLVWGRLARHDFASTSLPHCSVTHVLVAHHFTIYFCTKVLRSSS